MWEKFKLQFSLDVVVTIVFEQILWMNKLKTIDREAVSWKFLLKIQNVNHLKQFGKHYLDRGSVHASEIGWSHGKIQHKIHLNSGHIS